MGPAHDARAPTAANTITHDGHPRRTGQASGRSRRARAAARRAGRAAPLHARAPAAPLRLRAPDRPLGVAEAALARAPGDRRAVLRRPRRDVRDRQGRAGAARALVVDRPRLANTRPPRGGGGWG